MNDKYKVNIPEGKIGIWRIERFTVTPEDEKWERVRAITSFSSRGRFTPAGTYTRLMRGSGINETLVMSDTPDEVGDHLRAIYRAKGNCLVNGLGLGVVVKAMLDKPEVAKVTVIEIAPEVIGLVGNYYKAQHDGRLEIIEADALTWKPPRGTRYDCVWHDIWDNICADNLSDMEKLHRKYGKRTAWQGSWCREECRMQGR